jgi:hypothetical protein
MKKAEKKIKYNKSNLPEKICLQCLRPFNWRKKWEKCWEDVKYCSDACRKNKNN